MHIPGHRKGASRRTVLAGAAGAGAAAMTPSLFGGEARAAEPRRGGTLRFGFGHGSTTDSLDPATWEHAMTGSLGLGGIGGYLTAIDETGTLEPELATEWSASPGAKTWTFKLRRGVEFHNGKTVTGEDVVASLNHHRGPDTNSAVASLMKAVTDIHTDGDAVVIELEAGNADFAYLMSDYHMPIMPSDGEGHVDPLSGVGCGAYVLESFEPGVAIHLTNFGNYWRADRGWFDAVEMLTISDTTARMNALMSGEVDVADRVDLSTAHLLDEHPEVRLVEAVSTLHYTFPMRTDTAPFDDNNVRLAIKHAIDRGEVLEKILHGHGAIGNDQPIAPANRYYAADVEPFPYDPDKAKWYLKEAGYDSLTVDLSASAAAFGGAVDAAVLFKQHAAPAGIEINVVREPADGYWSDVWMKKPWCVSYWSGRVTEDWMFSTAYSSDAEWNETFWHNDRFNELLVEARVELDEDLRHEMYREMQMIVRDDGGALMPMFSNTVDAASNRLAHGPNIAGNYNLDGGRMMERWWFEDAEA